MKKKIQLLTLFAFLFLLTGCGYNDVYDEYGYILDDIDCTYIGTVNGQDYTLRFQADENSFFVNVNGAKHDLYNSRGIGNVQIGEYYVQVYEDDLIDMINYYDEDDGRYVCPNNIYISVDTNQTASFKTSCSVGTYVSDCISFSPSSSNATTNDYIVYSNRYTKRLSSLDNLAVTFYFGYNFDTSESYLFTNDCNSTSCSRYTFNGKNVYVGIENYNGQQLTVVEADYDEIFNINTSNRTVNWPTSNQINIAREFEGGMTVFRITTSTSRYNNYDNSDYTGQSSEGDNSGNSNTNSNSNLTNTAGNTSVSDICSSPSYRKPMLFLGKILNFVKIIVPIVIIVFGVLDFYKAITSSKDEGLSKAFKSLIIRAIAGVCIFLLPGIVQLVLNMVNEWSDYSNNWCCCTECLLNGDCDVNSCSSDSCRIEGMD